MTTVNLGNKAAGSPTHGGAVRGSDLSRRSSQFEGRFGRMFRSLPGAQWPEDALRALGAQMTVATDPARHTVVNSAARP